MRDPADLRPHALRKQIVLDVKDDEQWASFVDAMSGAGTDGIPPLFISADGRIMDGIRRWEGARQLQWREIACVVRPDEDAALLVVDSLFGQRNLTRCVKTYLALTILDEFVESAEGQRLRNLKKGIKTLEKPLGRISSSDATKIGRPSHENSLRSLAERFGVSKDTVHRAVQIYTVFKENPEIKLEWEPKLLAGEKNLWNVLSAVGGAGADQSGRGKGVEESQLEFWQNPWNGLKQAAPAWRKLDETRREAVLQEWRNTAAKLPQDLRSGMREILDELDSQKEAA